MEDSIAIIATRTIEVFVLGVLFQESSRWSEHTRQFYYIPSHQCLFSFVCLEILLLFDTDQSTKKYVTGLYNFV